MINVRLTDVQKEFYTAFLTSLCANDIESMELEDQRNLLRGMSTKILQHRYIFQYICCHPLLIKKSQENAQAKVSLVLLILP